MAPNSKNSLPKNSLPKNSLPKNSLPKNSWMSGLQIGDLDADQRLEMTCLRCGHVHYLTAPDVARAGGRMTLYLDEVEARTKCRARGCGAAVRLALGRAGDTSGFVGGMA
jgi:hypothetical protein